MNKWKGEGIRKERKKDAREREERSVTGRPFTQWGRKEREEREGEKSGRMGRTGKAGGKQRDGEEMGKDGKIKMGLK